MSIDDIRWRGESVKMGERAIVTPIGNLEPVCTVFGPFRRDRYSALAQHIEERMRAAFGMPPLAEDLTAYGPPPGARRIIPGQVIREP